MSLILPLYYIINPFKFCIKWYIFTTKPHFSYHLLWWFWHILEHKKDNFRSTNYFNNSPFVPELFLKYRFYPLYFAVFHISSWHRNAKYLAIFWGGTFYVATTFLWCADELKQLTLYDSFDVEITLYSKFIVHTDTILNADKLLNTRYYKLMK